MAKPNNPHPHPQFTPSSGTVPADPSSALANLASLGDRMALLRRRLADSMSSPFSPPLDPHVVSSEISAAVHDVILNATALLSASLPPPEPSPPPEEEPAAVPAAEKCQDFAVVDLDAHELVADHIHLCEICGKSFKRDANLRMHMRAHGDQFKTLSALSGPGSNPFGLPGVRFSCPVDGCVRNRGHRRFRPLKSAICAKNHFRRSHCPKLYNCERCGKKSFAVPSDLKSHLKNCGWEPQWRCTCGTTFSRKDKLFGHLALFKGHMPAIGGASTTPAPPPWDGNPKVDSAGSCDLEGDGDDSLDADFFTGFMEELGGGDGSNGI